MRAARLIGLQSPTTKKGSSTVNDRPSRGRDVKVLVQDAQSLPVAVVIRANLARLHEVFDGRRVAVARSIYLALHERAADADHEFTRGELANDAGVSKKTLDEYVPVFEEAGLLRVERRRVDGSNLPNVWILLGAGAGGWTRSVPSHADHPVHPSSDEARTDVVVEDGTGASACLPGLTTGSDVERWLASATGEGVAGDLVKDGYELLRRKTKVDGRLVTREEMAIVIDVIAEFNAQSGSGFGVGAHVKPIVGRIRERASMPADQHVRLVQSAWRIKWWERSGRGRRPTPAVIYGNAGVFEQVVQDAVDEKAGRAQPEQPKRFTRED